MDNENGFHYHRPMDIAENGDRFHFRPRTGVKTAIAQCGDHVVKGLMRLTSHVFRLAAACGCGGDGGAGRRGARRPRPARPRPAAAPVRRSLWWRRRTSGAASPASSAAPTSTETSIITNPDTDPHDYEPTAADARAIAAAQLVIVNGIGYDPWAPKLLAANPVPGRRTLTVGDLLGLKAGDNPHQWYSAAHVHQVIAAITADYKQLDPADAAYFGAQQHHLRDHGPGPLQPADRADQGQVRGHAGRRVGVDRLAAGGHARPEDAHAHTRS